MRKQNFNYCNESFQRGIESVALVWSRRELILVPSTGVIHHLPNNTVRGGEYDKKKKKKRSERGGVGMWGSDGMDHGRLISTTGLW